MAGRVRDQKQPMLLAAVAAILVVAAFVGWARQGNDSVSSGTKPRYPQAASMMAVVTKGSNTAEFHEKTTAPTADIAAVMKVPKTGGREGNTSNTSEAR